jgi:transposase-like protein
MSGKRPKYTPEFREQAARLVIESGRLWLDPQVTTRMPVSETEATFAMP